MKAATMTLLARLALSVIAIIGVVGGGAISLEHITSANACPMIGPLPACYIVTIAYSLILIAAWAGAPLSRIAFRIGWVIVFALAFIGSSMEFFSGDVCPKTAAGIPQCYISLGLAIGVLILYFALRRLAARG